MKRLVTYLLAAVLGAACCFTFVGCGGKDDVNMSEFDAMIAEAQKMTTEQLIEKAKAETGAFKAYGNTSRISTAMENFVAKYGAQLNLPSDSKGEKLSDSNIYTTITNEAMAANKSGNTSMVLLQDSAMLAQYREMTTMLANYVPDSVKAKVDDNNLVPLAHQFINKLFIYNNAGGNTEAKFSNVWELTEAKYKDRIYFKLPTKEQVNMNFLIMLTGDEWSAKLETAYKKLHNNEAAADVGEGKTYKNYGYKWVAEFLKNADTTSFGGDGDIAAGISQGSNAGKLGLFVLSKLRASEVTSENLQVSAWDKDASNNYVTIEPFAGFMYAIYAQVVTNGPRPYTAMLFINYLMTEEGFAPWCTSVGGYSSVNDIPVYEGDEPLSFWSERLVVEDGQYIKSVKATVTDWIEKQLVK